MQRFLCIHGHFYQPPRENPWLEEIEVQDSAYPYHDWNERITAECYEPNAWSRILDGDGRIVKIVNNYSQISFNFGPTLLSWLERHAPETYRRILEADRQSREQFSGHGSALAQCYSHLIMPLANRRDKVTQVRWGIRDFEHRFGRRPEGMWLPETAVDLETLDVLAEHEIAFTILAPNQAHEVRKYRGRTWHDVSGSRIDPTKAYEVRLPSGRRISVFFYDGPISRAVAFENLLIRGEYLAERLLGAFSDHRDWNQLVHIATDGESYGHHHRYGDMALAYALHYIAQQQHVKLTNYGEYLQSNPAVDEVRIFENSSWSCAHGIERWRSDCGCNSGGRPGWNQQWRGPLRAALDWLRDTLMPRYEAMAGRMFHDPWEARHAYIDVVLDRSPESIERFFARQASHRLGEAVTSHALMLLEMQRHLLLMYTSCGWFFDELSGIETVQILHYASRAIQLAEYLFQERFEDEFCRRLAAAKSNLPEHKDGQQIYNKWVRAARLELPDVAAHFAVSSLFEEYKPRTRLFAYTAEVQDYQLYETGLPRLAVGQVKITAECTRQSARLSFGVVHWGDHNVHGGVRPFESDEAYQQIVRELVGAFKHGEIAKVVRVLDQHFRAATYSLRSLFRDEQRKILNIIIDSGPAERAYRELYERIAPLLHFLASLDVPRPKAFRTAAEYVLNLDLRRAFENHATPQHIRQLLEEAAICGVELERDALSYALARHVVRFVAPLHDTAASATQLRELHALVSIARLLPFEVNLRAAQNLCYELAHTMYPQQEGRLSSGDRAAQEWVGVFRELAEALAVRLP
jgi:alpha-amylase/alpha-mannosidase (GH57 family)